MEPVVVCLVSADNSISMLAAVAVLALLLYTMSVMGISAHSTVVEGTLSQSRVRVGRSHCWTLLELLDTGCYTLVFCCPLDVNRLQSRHASVLLIGTAGHAKNAESDAVWLLPILSSLRRS